jgi:excisionase family DNA binding protein
MKRQDFYRIGEAANLLGFYPLTVSRMFDRGELSGHRLPFGRRERRISHESLVALAKSYPPLASALERLE